MKYIFDKYTKSNVVNYDNLHDKTVVIFGASHVGMIALYALKQNGINVSCYCDNKKEKQGTFFMGIPVLSMSELVLKFPDAAVFISSVQISDIKQQLNENGYTNIFNCVDLLQGLEIEDIFPVSVELIKRALDAYMLRYILKYKEDVLNIHSLDVVVTERCSLLCKDCANLMQYYENPIDCNEEILFIALDRFMKAVDYVHELRVIGGEPFMYRNLHSVLHKLSDFNNYGRLLIYTNGTIVPNDEMLSGYDTANIEVIIADYGKLSKNLERLQAKLDEKGIKHDTVKFSKWDDCATIKYHERTEDEQKHLYSNCCARDTWTLLHGKLYSCPFSAHSRNLNAIPSQTNSRDDEINCLDSSTNIGELRMRIRKLNVATDYINACQYCNGRDYSAATIPAAIQIESPVYYERIE